MAETDTADRVGAVANSRALLIVARSMMIIGTPCLVAGVGFILSTMWSLQGQIADARVQNASIVEVVQASQETITRNTDAISLLTNWLRSSDVADARAAEQIKALNHRIDTMAQRQKEGFARIERSLARLSGPG